MRSKILIFIYCAIIALGCNDKVEAELNTTEPLRVFPNPASQAAEVRVNISASTAKLLVFDPTGAVIFERALDTGSHQFTIDVSQRPSGKYEVVCKIGSIVYSRTLLKL